MTKFFGPEQPIPYEGPSSKNPLAFKYYEPDKKVLGKRMEDHLRFAVCYWHSFCNMGHDPFGPGTRHYPWDVESAPIARAEAKLDAAFEFFTKLGVPYYCFHDIDMAPDADDIGEYEKNLKHMVALAKERQSATGVCGVAGEGRPGHLESSTSRCGGCAYEQGSAEAGGVVAVEHAAIDATDDAIVANTFDCQRTPVDDGLVGRERRVGDRQSWRKADQRRVG